MSFQAHLDAHETWCSAAQCGTCGFVFSTREECQGHWRVAHAQNAAKASRRAEGAARRAPGPDGDAPSGCKTASLTWSGSAEGEQLSAPPPPPPPEEVVRQIKDECASLKETALRQRLRQFQLLWHPDHAWRRGVDGGVACKVFVV